MITNITYEFWKDDSAQFGPEAELDSIDIKASYRRFMADVENAIKAEYPQAEVDVHHGPGNPDVTCYGDDDDEAYREVRYIEDIVHEVWEAWDWIVEK